MRAPLFIALTLAIGLTACNNQPAPVQQPQAVQPAGPPPVPADVPAIRGRLNIDGLSQLTPGLTLRLRLLDITDPAVVPPVVAERSEPAPIGLPVDYALPYEPAAIDEEGRYVLEAALLADAFVMYGTPAPVPALTQGAGQRINLQLTRGGAAAPVVAPADALRGEFERIEGGIGGMRRIAGDRIDGNITIGWDAFVDDTGVRFAREIVDFGDAGTASYRYAYRDGQPWVVAREQRGTLAMVGWGDDGSLLLNRVGEDNGGVDDAEAERLRQRALTLHKIAAAQAARG